MNARELLENHYQMEVSEKIICAGREGYISNSMLHFIMNALNSETFHLEQAVIAYYLLESNWKHVAIPIKNKNDQWFTDQNEERFIVYQVNERQIEKESVGTTLANLHQIGTDYPFEPKNISSYGLWKKLWSEKITVFEENLIRFVNEEEKEEHSFYMDALPYMIGMSENAIQYLRETEEKEGRYSEADSGTFCFQRFHGQTYEAALWPDEFVYDHSSRDLAEYIRLLFLNGATDESVRSFLADYQQVRPLSIFSWRLIYARLIYPIHLLDSLEESVRAGDIHLFKKMFRQQSAYELRLRDFFRKVGIDKKAVNIEELDWLIS